MPLPDGVSTRSGENEASARVTERALPVEYRQVSLPLYASRLLSFCPVRTFGLPAPDVGGQIGCAAKGSAVAIAQSAANTTNAPARRERRD